MKESISVLGCGWLGKALAIQLARKGYPVKGSNTTDLSFSELTAAGISPFIIDLNKHDNNFDNFLSSDILVISITSKNVTSFNDFIQQIKRHKIKKILFISSSSVYPKTNGIVTEETSVVNTFLSKVEDLFKSNTNFQSTIIRFGGLFGYNRKPGNFFKDNKKIQDPDGCINLIHRDDCIQIIEHVIEREVWNETLNASTDTHPTRREFYKKEMIKLGREKPIFNEDSTNEYKIVSSEKLKKLLNYFFKYPDLLNYTD